jgi:hypothetical protein
MIEMKQNLIIKQTNNELNVANLKRQILQLEIQLLGVNCPTYDN